MDILLIISSLASALAAVLAWSAKLWWGKEYGAAKNETIKAKDAQIELLKREVESYKELTPMKIREYFISVKGQLEEYNDSLKLRLEETQSDIERKEATIEKMRAYGNLHSDVIERLREEKKGLSDTIDILVEEIKVLHEGLASIGVIISTPLDTFIEPYGRVNRELVKAPTGKGKTKAALRFALSRAMSGDKEGE